MKHILMRSRGIITHRRLLVALLLGFVVGTVWLLGLRFLLQSEKSVHYHANFAIFIQGSRDPLSNFTFYEEVASCGGNDHNNPKSRVHMHDNASHTSSHVIHVHDTGATWGHLVANLGYTLGNSVLKTDDGVYVDAQNGQRLSFVLNGEAVPTIANRVIGDKDVVLISYGSEDQAALRAQYESIEKDAPKYNLTADPASCSGGQSDLSVQDRFRRAIDLTQ